MEGQEEKEEEKEEKKSNFQKHRVKLVLKKYQVHLPKVELTAKAICYQLIDR